MNAQAFRWTVSLASKLEAGISMFFSVFRSLEEHVTK